MVWPRRLWKLLKWLAIAVAAGYVCAYFFANDKRLAGWICNAVNPEIRGRLEMESVHWGLLTPWHGRVRGFRILDPAGREVIGVSEASASAEVTRLPHDVILHDIVPAPGARVVVDSDAERGFVASFAPRVHRPPSKSPGRFHLDGTIANAVVAVKLGDALELALHPLKTRLLVDLHGKDVRLALDPQAPAGSLTLLGARLPISGLKVDSFGASDARPHDLAFDLRATVQKAPVHVSGALRDAFTEEKVPQLDLNIDIERGGPVVHDLMAVLLPLLDFGGADVGGRIRITGPPTAIQIAGENLHGIDIAASNLPLRATGVRGQLHVDPQTGRIALADLRANASTGGEIQVPSLTIDLPPPETTGSARLDAKIQLQGVDLTPLVPADQRNLLGGRLTGGGTLEGQVDKTLHARGLDLVLVRTHPGQLPARIRVRGEVGIDVQRERLDLKGLRAEGDGVLATATGSVGLHSQKLDLAVSGQAPRLGPLLQRLGAPPDLARALSMQGRVTGTVKRPSLAGSAQVDDLGIAELRIPRTTARVSLEDGTLAVDDVVGKAPAAKLAGSGRVRLEAKTAEAELGLSEVDLAPLGLGLSGHATVQARVSGPLYPPAGEIKASVRNLAVSGDRYDHAALEATLDREGVHLRHLRLDRSRGGSLAGGGHVGWDGALDLKLSADRFPLRAVPGVAELPVEVAGTVSGQFSVAGTTSAPRPAGSVTLSGARVRGIALGDGKLEMIPGGDAIHLRGNFFQRFAIDGTVTMGKHPALAASILFQGLPVEQLFPELARLGEVRGVASGRVDLSLAAGGVTYASARLSELRLTAHVTDDDGTARRIDLVNEDEVRVVYDGTHVRFDHLHMQSDKGELLVTGYLDAQKSALSVRGSVDLELIEFFAHRYFAHTHGRTVADLRVTGPMARPVINGTLQLEKVMLSPVDFDHSISIPAGLVTFSNDGVKLENLRVAVGEAEARAQGRLGLKEWDPQDVHLEVDGKVNAKLLELITEQMLHEVVGVAAVHMVLEGPAKDPRIQGSMTVLSPGIELDVRGYGRHVQILEGEVKLENHQLAVNRFHTKVDDGDLRLDGHMQLVGYRPKDVKLNIRARDLPHHDPGVYEVTVAGDLQLRGDADSLALSGRVELVDGRYTQQYELKEAIIPHRTSEASPPFWQDVPVLEQLALDLDVHSAGPLYVENNLARQLKLEAHLQVSGVLAEPQLSGDITVLEGTFRIPFLGDEFTTVPGGTVRFYRGKQIPTETPELNIQAEKPYTDCNDQEYQVTLLFAGPLGRSEWSLSTNTGLGTAATLSLLGTCRPPSDLRQSLRGGGASAGNPGDNVIKEGTADILREVVSDPIRQALHITDFSVFVGPDSIDFKERLRLSQHPRLDLLGLQSLGILNRSTQEGKAELKLHDYIFLDGQIQHLNQGTETEEDTLYRGRGQIRFRYRLRF